LVRFVAIGAAVAGLTGCGGSAGSMVKKSAAERPDWDRSMAQKGTLRLPSEASFNYTSFQSGQSQPGRGEASPVGKAGAMCRAQASEGGSAWAEFLLGYCFDNTSGASLDAVIKLRLKAARRQATPSGRASDPAAAPPVLSSSLRFFVKDTNGRTIRSEDLFSESSERSPSSEASTHELAFDVRFEPDRGYYLVLKGRVQAETRASQSAEVSLEASDASMDIEWLTAEPAAGAPAGTALGATSRTSAGGAAAGKPR